MTNLVVPDWLQQQPAGSSTRPPLSDAEKPIGRIGRNRIASPLRSPYSTASCRKGFSCVQSVQHPFLPRRLRPCRETPYSISLPKLLPSAAGPPSRIRFAAAEAGEAGGARRGPPRPRAGSVVPGPGAVRAPCPGPPLRTAGGCPSQPSRLRSCLDPERGVGGGKDCQAWDPERRRGVGQRQGRAAAWAAACGNQSARSRAQEVRVHAAAGSRARSPGGCFRQTVMLLWALHDGSPNGRR